MFKPEITSHEAHGVPAQSIYIPGHGHYDVRTDTLALVTAYLAHLTTPELRKLMTRNHRLMTSNHRDSEGVDPELGGVRRAELLFIAAGYPTLYVPSMIQRLGLECDTEGRYWVPQQPEATETASPFVAGAQHDISTVTEAQLKAAFLAARSLGKILDDDVLRAIILAGRTRP